MQMTLQLTSINPTFFPSSNDFYMRKIAATLLHLRHQTTPSWTYLHSMRKSLYTHLLSPPSILQVMCLALGVCAMNVSVLLTHGEKAPLSMIVFLQRLIQMLPGCVVLTLLMSGCSSPLLTMVPSIHVLLCTGFHMWLNQQIEAWGCGL
jgi:hypothetical protein